MITCKRRDRELGLTYELLVRKNLYVAVLRGLALA